MPEILKLNRKIEIKLRPKPPFSFDPSMHKPDHFPSADTVWEPGVRWQTMVWSPFATPLRQGFEGQEATGDKHLGLKFVDCGSVEEPKIKLEICSAAKAATRAAATEGWSENLINEINRRYGFQEDFSEFNRRFKDDPQLGPIIEKWPGMRVMSPQSLYEYLVIGIILQNCTVKRSVNMMQVLFENYGTKVRFDGREFYCFWEPEVLDQVSEEDLRALKIGYRAKSLKRISAQFAAGEISEFELRKKSKEEQREALLDLYGVGPATVGYILFDGFKHYDELSHISPWEQKIYSKLFFDLDYEDYISAVETGDAPFLLDYFEERFGKYKMLAVHYIWEDLWWRRKHQPVPWLEGLIRL